MQGSGGIDEDEEEIYTLLLSTLTHIIHCYSCNEQRDTCVGLTSPW